ncbi:hypothetical protein F6B93_19740 [Mycobacterium spongiae]|uniref:YbjN domain-containing protein n=1 Tax=Mycobacterium spongiae TaxID=886343 RepID=A0A975K228_9MYCO|nr:hypothetical protein F6B93_19740 [Mycobacterium spongiae]
MGDPLSTSLIEGYLRTRGRRYFRGQHDGEFFFVANAHPWRLHVHLEICPAQPDVLTIRVAPPCFFPASDEARLAELADTSNGEHPEVAVVVHGSSDPSRIGVTVQQSRRFGDPVRRDDLAAFIDRSIAAAIDFFGELGPIVQSPSTAPPLLRDAG